MALQFGERSMTLNGNPLFLGIILFFYALSQFILKFPEGPWGVFLLSFLFIVIGLKNILLFFKRKKERETLKLNGLQLNGTVLAVKRNKEIQDEMRHSPEISNKPPFRIVQNYEKYYTVIVEAEDRLTGGAAKKIFYSDYLVRDPSSYITAGQPITIFVNTSKPETYYVDLGFLPEKAK